MVWSILWVQDFAIIHCRIETCWNCIWGDNHGFLLQIFTTQPTDSVNFLVVSFQLEWDFSRSWGSIHPHNPPFCADILLLHPIRTYRSWWWSCSSFRSSLMIPSSILLSLGIPLIIPWNILQSRSIPSYSILPHWCSGSLSIYFLPSAMRVGRLDQWCLITIWILIISITVIIDPRLLSFLIIEYYHW